MGTADYADKGIRSDQMRTDELDFELPPELIAQVPPERRADSRLMHYRRADHAVAHRRFSDLPDLLRPGDLLVFNDARVLPARFTLRKSTGGRVEGLFLKETGPGQWLVMLKNLGNVSGPLAFVEEPGIQATVARAIGSGEYEVAINSPVPANELLSRVGRMPLPPYIKREKDHDERDDLDRVRYQTVFARAPGAVAAPTAALHFTPELLDALAARGVERTFVTLHVGLGTFKPVTASALEDHAMHVESYSMEPAAAYALNRAKAEGRRIVAVGTTATRVLESQPAEGPFVAKSGETGIFIYPPYPWKHVGAMITNFHLPRSTLIALVAAMVGLDEQRRLYRLAIEERYRFFSYGDAMLIV
jgi:S-adenosylmethionine:tRNA ribosyltransferase-isomerase